MLRTPLLVLLPALLAATACGYGSHSGDRYGNDSGADSCGTNVERGVIDTDALLDVEPAVGVGVFVEYTSGGRWHVFTSCDTDESGYDCVFDIIVQPLGQSRIAGVSPEGLESQDDSLTILGADKVELVSRTDYDFDGFTLDTDPGAGISVDAFLDGSCTNYVYWVGDGAVHDGAPSSPIEFVPSAD
jgi:hypothetical protein